MKKRKLIITAIILAVTVIIALIYLTGRTQAPKGSLTVTCEGKEVTVNPFIADEVVVEGTTINGKGEEKEISDTGVTLKSVLDLAKISSDEISSVKVVSSDEYSAELSASEITAEGIAYLVGSTEDDGTVSIRLIVFGDSNSKRQVKDVVRIDVTR
jgi:nitrous oxidase accessory protein NosD